MWAKAVKFSLRLDTHLLKCYTQDVQLWSFRHLVIYQLPCPVSPELSTKQIGQSEGSKVFYSSSISWPLRPLHLTNQKTAQVTAYSSIWQQQWSCLPLKNKESQPSCLNFKSGGVKKSGWCNAPRLFHVCRNYNNSDTMSFLDKSPTVYNNYQQLWIGVI